MAYHAKVKNGGRHNSFRIETMKAHIMPIPVESHGLRRVAEALVRHAPPGVEMVDQDEADLVVLHVIGRQDRNRARAERLTKRGQRYAVVQYCVRSTMRPSTEGWLPLWENAVTVWSYYDLKALCIEDGTPTNFEFYHAPLGADGVFHPRNGEREYVIATHGVAWTAESVREAYHAAMRVGGEVFHLGQKFRRDCMTCMTGIDDDTLAKMYSRCEFVACLRRTEGFELPAVEGLLCGARPVCFDRDHYRQWYEPWAVFIQEGSREEVIDSLEVVFHEGARPVSDAERRAVRTLFNWEAVVGGFWSRVT